MGINGFEGVGPEWLLPKRRSPCLRFGREEDLKGERGKPIYRCMPIELSLFFSLVSSLFFSVFFLIFFLFFLLCFSFYSVKMLCFSILPSGHGKGLFIVPAMTKVLPFCPLTAFVWSGRTCRPPKVCATHSCQTEAGFISPSTVALLSCHGILALSLHSQGMHPTVPPQTCLFWVVCHPSRMYLPKGLGQEPQIDLFPSPHHQTIPPYLLPLAHGPTKSYIGWVQAGGTWVLRVLSFQICPRVCLLLMRLP